MGTEVALRSRRAAAGATREFDRAAPSGTTTALSDEELACRAQRGCADSFEQLMRRFQAPVLHFLRRRGDEAEDLLQETFIRAYANLFRYRSQWRFATWLFTIARRVSITNRRRPPRPESREAILAAAECGRPGPVEVVMEEENRRYLWRRAAQILSEEEVTALWLHYGESLGMRDIAAVLGRSSAAVKTMLFRARHRLVPLLEEFTPDGADCDPRLSGAQKNVSFPTDVEARHV
ncbi:MAG: RNA polymerase sigma factor [Thermoguttaceae bacterium]